MGEGGGGKGVKKTRRQTGAISPLGLPLILSVKSCNACACMHTHAYISSCMLRVCVGVKFF